MEIIGRIPGILVVVSEKSTSENCPISFDVFKAKTGNGGNLPFV